jgi:uncharacterized protein YggT (Ycf19 family)
MFVGWMLAGIVLGTIAAVIFWTLIVALAVTWYEDRHHNRSA